MNFAAPAGVPNIVVGVGDCRVARAPSECLMTYALGSCIAVIMYDWRLQLGGLLHVMLPDSSIDTARASKNPHAYVDTGIPALIKKMSELGSVKKDIRCCMTGGAQMHAADSAHFEIGKKNHLALKKIFWRMGMFIDREDVGGTESRSVRLDIRTGQVDLRIGADRHVILVNPGRL